MEENNSTLKQYLGSAIGGLIVAVAMMWGRGLFEGGHTMQQIMVILSDSFFVPGTILLGVGLLMWVAGEGMFDMLGFGVKLIFDVAFKHEWESFYDYKLRKAEKPRLKVGFMTLVGLGYLLVGVLFTGLYYMV